MADDPENLVLVYLRRMDAKIGAMADDIAELKRRQSETHRAVLALRRDQNADAEVGFQMQAQIDRLRERIDRIDRRLDLTDVPE